MKLFMGLPCGVQTEYYNDKTSTAFCYAYITLLTRIILLGSLMLHATLIALLTKLACMAVKRLTLNLH